MHVISDKSIQDALSIKQEIAGIQHVLRKRGLDVAAITIPSIKSLEKHYTQKVNIENKESKENKQNKNIPMNTNDLFAASVNSYLLENITDLSDICNKGTELGIDLSTEWLATASVSDVTRLLSAIDQLNVYVSTTNTANNAQIAQNDQNVDNDNDSTGSSNVNSSDSIYSTDSSKNNVTTNNARKKEGKMILRKVSCVSIATNSFTFKHLEAIHTWAKARGKIVNHIVFSILPVCNSLYVSLHTSLYTSR